mmetsp:Transcript_19176/g.47406  ORF Transcript_19176/g.47406 Transcript_19176/m.47406 type:complete len:231 (+) Transcript_19176:2835-3527(+)
MVVGRRLTFSKFHWLQNSILNQSKEACLAGQIPSLPQWMIGDSLWQGWIGLRSTIQTPQDPIRQEKVSKHGGQKQVLTKQSLKERLGQDIPGNTVRDCRKDPIQLSQWCLAVVWLSGNGVYRFWVQAPHGVLVASDKPSKGNLDWGRQTGCKNVGWIVWMHRKALIFRCWTQDDCVLDPIGCRRIHVNLAVVATTTMVSKVVTGRISSGRTTSSWRVGRRIVSHRSCQKG